MAIWKTNNQNEWQRDEKRRKAIKHEDDISGINGNVKMNDKVTDWVSEGHTGARYNLISRQL